MSPRSVLGLLLQVAVLGLVLGDDSNKPRFISKRVDQFQVIFEWKQINFTWANQDEYRNAVASRSYVPENVIISGIKYHGNRFYFSLPRIREGVPATLAWITHPTNITNPELTPFPSLEKNTVGTCGAFQSVDGFEIDLTGHMWVVDNGRTGYNTTQSSCQPSLIIVDLNDARHSMVRHTFPVEVVDPATGSHLRDIVLDDNDGGYAYISDSSPSNPGIVVYSRKLNKSWKFTDNGTMTATPEGSAFSINGYRFNRSTNINGIALGPNYINKKNVVDRNVYYTPLSSLELHGVPASVLRNESYSVDASVDRSTLVARLGKKSSQTNGMIMDEEGYLYFGLLSNCSIAIWDHKVNFEANQENISKDLAYIQWVDRFAFDDQNNIYTVVNKMHKFVDNQLNGTEYNFRVLKAHVRSKSYMYSPKLLPEKTVRKLFATKKNANGSGAVRLDWLTVATAMAIATLGLN